MTAAVPALRPFGISRLDEIAAILAEGVWRVLCGSAPDGAISSVAAAKQPAEALDVSRGQSVHVTPPRPQRRRGKEAH
jgi:hypothetical protein